MRSKAPDLPNHQSRPVGVRVLAACLAVYGVQSLGGVVQLFPLWLESASNHRYGNESFVWLKLVSAIAALAGAYGLWRQRRWVTPSQVVYEADRIVLS